MHGPRCTAPPPPPPLPLPLPLLVLMLLCGASVCLSAAAAQASSGNWEPLFIHVSTKDLEDSAKYCNETGARRPNFYGGVVECFKDDVVTEEERMEMLNTIIPTAVKLHTDRLLVQRFSSPLVVPSFVKGNPCSFFTVPMEHHTTGVSNADIVLYVAITSWRASTDICTVDNNGRPTASALKLNRYSGNLRHDVRIFAHEIAHGLGFQFDLMYLHGLTKTVHIRKPRFSIVVTAMISNKTVTKAREHLNCSLLAAFPLERGDPWTISHWSATTAKDELMASPFESGGFYTALTMAAFEDLGFFRARWGMEEPMRWGRNVGCDFPPENCTAEALGKLNGLICDVADQKQRCTFDRSFVGKCDLNTNRIENCSTVSTSWLCEDERPNINLLGSLTGRGSWCLDADALVVNKEDNSTEEVAGVCAKVKCDGGNVQVQYRGGNDTWHDCPEGSTITPSSSSFSSGSIKCPTYAEVCTIADNGSSLVTPPTTPSITLSTTPSITLSTTPSITPSTTPPTA